jgi:transcriptional regulator with XRE-family HTH domain
MYAPRIPVPGKRSRGGRVSRIELDIGRELRSARLARGWTLKDLSRHSNGRFKPSAVGGYERGERSITVERFSELAILYGTPPDVMLAAALEPSGPLAPRDIVIDLSRVDRLDPNERAAVDSLVQYVAARRRQAAVDRIRLRWADLVLLAEAAGIAPGEMIGRMHPALVRLTEPSPAPG